jgi:large subunit ribosomal protein L25
MALFTVQRRSRSTSKPKHLRKQGLLPMALVERTHETTFIQASVVSLREAISHADGLGRLDLQIEGEKGTRKAIVKHIEHDALKHQLIHVTLQEVNEDDSIKIDLPVVIVGQPTAMETEDALLTVVTDHIKVKGKMSSLPERLELDITNLEVGHHIEASAIELPEGVELLSSPDATIVSLRLAALATEEVLDEPAATEEDAINETPETDHEGEA